jgi:hypothetical protein
MNQLAIRLTPRSFHLNSPRAAPPPADIYIARKYHACGSHRHKGAKNSLRSGDLEEATFVERLAIELFLRSMHGLNLGGGNLERGLPQIWEELTKAGLQPPSELTITEFTDTGALERLDRLFVHGDQFETESAVRLAIADPAHEFMPEKI